MPFFGGSQSLGATVEVSEIESLAKGALIVGDGSGAPSTLAAGTNDHVLTLDSTQTLGLKWAELPGGGDMLSTNNLSDLDDASAARANLGVEIGADVQAYAAILSTFAALTSAADKLPYYTGAGTMGTTDFSAFARMLLDDADAGTARGTLGLGSIATQNSNNVTITGGSISGVTDIAVADGGTGASDAGTARTNLGVAIGSDVQAYSAMLAALAALASTGLIARTGSGTAAVRTITGTANRITVSNGDGVSGNPTLDVGTNVYVSGGTDVAIADGGTGSSTAEGAFSNLKQAASDSATGVVELATAAETTTGTDTARAITPDGLAGSDYGKRVVTIMVSDPNGSAITTGDGKAYWRVPAVMNGYNLVAVAAHVTTASSSGTPTIQINNVTQGADMLSTRITIDANEKDSSTAAAAAVIDASNDDVATGDEIRIDIDTAGTGTKGLMVEMTFQLP